MTQEFGEEARRHKEAKENFLEFESKFTEHPEFA